MPVALVPEQLDQAEQPRRHHGENEVRESDAEVHAGAEVGVDRRVLCALSGGARRGVHFLKVLAEDAVDVECRPHVQPVYMMWREHGWMTGDAGRNSRLLDEREPISRVRYANYGLHDA